MASSAAASSAATTADGGNGDDAKAKKSRLIAFFRRYAPQDLYKVEMVLQSPLPEEQLFAELRTKYNVPSASSPGTAELNSDVADIRERLTAFYQRYAPNDVAKVDNALQMNLLEGQLFNALYTKYNVPPAEQTYSSVAPIPPSPSASVQGSTTSSARKRSMSRTSSAAAPGAQGTPQQREAFKQRLTELYKKVSPSDYAQKVQHAMSLNIPEQVLLDKIHEKYNLGPDGEPRGAANAVPAVPSSPSSATLTSTKEQQLRERLRTFYAIHNPNEVETKVQNAMKLGLDETELFRLLHNKYGLNEDGSPRQTANATSSSSIAASATDAASPVAASPSTTLEERLLAFYRVHNPTEASAKVAAAMRLKVPEQQLWANLYKAYNLDEKGNKRGSGAEVGGGDAESRGAEASSAPASSEGVGARPVPAAVQAPPTFRQRLEAFYKTHAPDSVEQKVMTAMSLNLSEEETFALLHQKYKVVPPPTAQPAQPSDAAQPVAQGSTAVGAVEEPQAVPVDATPSLDPSHAFGSSPPRELNLEELRRRLHAFFTRYEADGDVAGRVRDSVDVVASGHMTEDELIRFIEQQYGPALELRMDDAALPPAKGGAPGPDAGAARTQPGTQPSSSGAATVRSCAIEPTPSAPEMALDAPVAAPLPPPPTEASVRREASEAALKKNTQSGSASPAVNDNRAAFRERLRSFYAAHGVDEAEAKIEYAMRIDGDEDGILAKLSAKYSSQDQASSAPSAMTPKIPATTDDDAARMKQKRQEKLRQRLTAFYERYNPSNMDKIDLALTLDIPEDVLFAKLYEKYNLNPKGEPLEVGGALSRFDSSVAEQQHSSPVSTKRDEAQGYARRDLEDRLFLMYAKVLPAREAESKARSVAQSATDPADDVLRREAAALRPQADTDTDPVSKLERTEGSPPPQAERGGSGGASTEVPTAPPVGVVRGSDMKDRLTAFYEAHKASEVPRVDAILQSSFSDEMIWQRLRDRYGNDAVEPFCAPPGRALSSAASVTPSQRSPNTLERQSSMATGKGPLLPSTYTPPRRIASSGPSAGRTMHSTGSALDRLVREAVEEPLDALPLPDASRPTGAAGSSISSDMEPERRAVSFLMKLPDANMFLLQRAGSSAREDFYSSFERDARSYVLVHGAVAGTPTTRIDPMRDDVVCMTYVALFQTAAGAAQFRSSIVSEGDYAAVPIPATRAAYLLIGGNPQAAREAKVAGAMLVEPPEALAVIRGGAPEATPTPWTALNGHPDRQTPPPPDAFARHASSVSPDGDVRRRGAAEDPEAPRGVTESLRMRHAASARLPQSTDAMLGNDAELGLQAPTWGDILARGGSPPPVASAPATSIGVPTQTREQFIVAKERELTAFSLELTERARLVQEREVAVSNAEQRVLQAQSEEREANRARRDASADASVRFQSLTVREAEVKERERMLSHKEEELLQRETIVASRLTDASQRFALLEEREHRLALREKQLDDVSQQQQQRPIRGHPPPLYGSPLDYYQRDDGSEAASLKQYAMQLELRLKEAQQRVAALEGNPASAASAMAAAAQHGLRDDMDLRLRHIVEREAQVSEAELRLERTALESMQSVQHRDDAMRRRWDDLRSQDRELLARRLEVEAIHDSVQRAARGTSQGAAGASTAGTQAVRPALFQQQPSSPSPLPGGGPRAAAMTPSPHHTPIPSFSFAATTGNGLIRQDDISVMLQRVKEREKMLRSMSERITPTRAFGR